MIGGMTLEEWRQRVSHLVLRPNQILIVCVPKNQVYTHTI
jgi:hypothetical protein